MKKYRRSRKLNIVMMTLLSVLFLVACGETVQTEVTAPEQTEEKTYQKAGEYDSVDSHAVVLSISTEKKLINFLNQKTGKTYTLNYDGTSKIYDKYNSSMVIDQINPGDVVDVTFLKSKKLLNSMTKSADVWVYEIEDFKINSLNKRVTMMDGDYRYTDKLQIFSDGVKAQVMDINACDKLVISGSEHDIYSIVVAQGHGYIRLKGQDYFEGGWIEIGQKIIKQVTSDMLLTVPVGTYDISLSNGKYQGKRTVSINKNKETELDVSDMVDVDITKYGNVVLVTSPSDAEVYIDGQVADLTKPLSLEYGIHQLIARADGYETLTQYIKVGQENATLEVSLEKNKDVKENTDSEEGEETVVPQVTSVVTQAVSVDSSNYRVYIEAPDGAELYVDGSYTGIVPTSFVKSAGTHEITLRKDGYVTRSFTIELSDTAEDETFSFTMEEEDFGTIVL